MIRIKVKVKNDHRSLTEDFEADELNLSPSDPIIQKWVEKVLQAFNEPVDEVIIKTHMEI